jgi:hypothetical protein
MASSDDLEIVSLAVFIFPSVILSFKPGRFDTYEFDKVLALFLSMNEDRINFTIAASFLEV